MERSNRFNSALNDFHQARRQASMQEIMARLTGKSAELLSYEDVRQKLKLGAGVSRGLRDVPLNAIVGSVDRYTDFTRTFLPRPSTDASRWARVQLAVNDLAGLPPIELYKIGDVYFVLDGNHRVSVAHQMGATFIQAYVTEVPTKVPLSPDTQPDDLIIKARYADFLERTRLHSLRPHADLSVTAPGQYRVIEEQIQLHRYLMGQEQGREVPLAEAAAHWYDEVYLPTVQIIREHGIMRGFPGRTETDLYVWLSEHHAALEKELGWEIKPSAAAADLVHHYGSSPQSLAARVSGKLLDVMTPDQLESGPPPGQWRQNLGWDDSRPGQDRYLFGDILVPVSGSEPAWQALEQALEVARREGGRLRGLHVVARPELQNGPEALAVQAEFNRRCESAGVEGKLVVEVGGIARKICERSRWTDLIVLHLAHPPGQGLRGRLNSGFRTLIQRCSSPVLAVPRPASRLDRALLAYDGSPRAREALFVAAYLAARWDLTLAVVTVVEGDHITSETLASARAYLEARGVEATYVPATGPVTTAILKAAAEHQSNLIIIGGYGFNPVLEVLLGSSVDHLLQASWQPVLICR